MRVSVYFPRFFQTASVDQRGTELVGAERLELPTYAL